MIIYWIAFKRFFLTASIITFMHFFWQITPLKILTGGNTYCNLWGFRSHAPFPVPSSSDINPLSWDTDSLTHYFCNRVFIHNYFSEKGPPLWWVGYWLVVLYVLIVILGYVWETSFTSSS